MNGNYGKKNVLHGLWADSAKLNDHQILFTTSKQNLKFASKPENLIPLKLQRPSLSLLPYFPIFVGYTISPQINFNNKAQNKQQMSQLRTRPIQKPLILQSYVYDHRPQYNQSSPQASFLKMSEKNSTELQAMQESSIFADMQNRLNRLEERSMGKICDIQREIQVKERERQKKMGKTYKPSLIREKRQAEVMTYRKLQGCAYNMESFEQSNFQMDENLNYICDAHNEMTSNLVRDMIEAKGINSEPFGKQSFTLRQIRPFDRNNKSNVSRRSSLISKKQASPCNQRENSQNNSKSKRKLSSSLCKDSKTGSNRIYEQILSNYSTAKLLAMQKKHP